MHIEHKFWHKVAKPTRPTLGITCAEPGDPMEHCPRFGSEQGYGTRSNIGRFGLSGSVLPIHVSAFGLIRNMRNVFELSSLSSRPNESSLRTQFPEIFSPELLSYPAT